MDHNSVEITVPPDSPRYIISLDNFDTSFLYTYPRRSEVPLWSTRGPDYMEFQVFSQETPSDPNGEELENSNSYRCHICAVDVPVAYVEAHIASPKHQMYSAVVWTSLERNKNQMTVELPARSLAPRPSTCFCESCSRAINCSDLDTHNASKEHVMCQKRDEYMDHLIQMYQDPGKFEDFLKTCEVFKVSAERDEDIKDVVGKDEPKLSRKEEVLRCIERVNRMTVHKIRYIDDDTIEICTRSGAKVAVDWINFHGLCEDAGKVVCRVCRALVDDKYTHMNHEGHIKKITAAIKDKHCIRQLDQILNHCILCNEIVENSEVHVCTEKHESALKDSMIDDSSEIKKILTENLMEFSAFSKNVYFCSLCQIYVENNSLQQHVSLDYHVELLSKANKTQARSLIKRGKKKVATNEPQYCITCKKLVQGGKKGMRAHTTTPDHKYLGWLTTKDTKIHHHLTKISLVNNATCKVCKIIISADKSAMDAHIASTEHQSKVQDLLQENKMAVVNEKYITCNACEIQVLTFDDLKHMVKKNHKNNVAKKLKCADEDKDTQHFLVLNRDYQHCDICGATIERKYYDEHINGKWHLDNVSKRNDNIKIEHNQAISSRKSELQNDRMSAQDSNLISFDVNLRPDSCQTAADETNIDGPMDTPAHAHQRQKKDVFEGDYCTVCQASVRGGEKSKKQHVIFSDHRYKAYLYDMENGTRFHHHMKVSGNQIICKVCKIEIEANKTSVQIHIESHKHRAKYGALSHNLLTQISEERVKCSLCDRSFLIIDEINHLTTKCHVKNLRDHGYDVNLVDSVTDNSISDTSDSLKIITEEVLRNNKLIKCGHEYYCEAGCVTLEHSSVDIHVDSDMHRINLSEKPPANTDDLNTRREDETVTAFKDYTWLNQTSVCKDPTVNIASDDFNCESDSSFASAKTSLTESKPFGYTEIMSEIKTEDVTSYLTSDFAHLFREENLEQLTCQICDSLVPIRFDLYIEHVEGMKHTTKYESFLLKNDIKEFVDSEKETVKKYHCFTCGVDLLHSRLIPHVATERHTCKLAAAAPSSSGDLKEILQRDLQTAAKVHRTYFMEYNRTDLFCNLCNSEVVSKHIGKHIQSPTHQDKVDAVLHENETRKIGDSIVCGVCKLILTGVNEIEHIFSDSHKRNIQIFAFSKTKRATQNVTNSQGYLCDVCNVEILGNENIIQLHIAGNRHKSNILKLSTATVQPPKSKQVHDVQPIEKIQIKEYVFCDICKTKYENNPDDKRKHEKSNFHKECQKYSQTLNYEQPQSSKGRNKTVYLCKSYEQDPFYLMNKLTGIQCNTKLQTASGSNCLSVLNFIPGVPLYYSCESDEKDPFYLLSAIATDVKNKTELQTAGCSNKMSIFNFIPGVPLYYTCESDEKDPFYLLSAIATDVKNKTELQTAGCSNKMTIFNFIPGVPLYYTCESYDKDPFYLLSAVSKKSNIKTEPQSVGSNNMSAFNFIPDAPLSPSNWCKSTDFMLWCDAQYDKASFKLISAILKKSSIPTNLQNKSKENPKLITQSQETKEVTHLTNFPDTTKVTPTNADEHLIKSKHIIQNMANKAHSSTNNNATAATQPNPQKNAESMCITNDNCSDEHLIKSKHIMQNMANKAHSSTNNNTNAATQPNPQKNAESMCITNDYCSVCSTKVAPANVRQHLVGARHRENVAIRNNAKLIATTNNEHVNHIINGYCAVCKVKVPIGRSNIVGHLKGANHVKNAAVAQKCVTNTNTCASSPQTNYIVDGFCTVCQVKVPVGSVNNITIHVNGKYHKENVAAAQKNNAHASTSSAQTNRTNAGSQQMNHIVSGVCTVCKVAVPSGSENIAIHVNGHYHKENVAAKKNKTLKNTNVSIPTESRNKNYCGVFSAIPRTNENLCNICNVKVSNSIKCLDQHLEGALHKEIAEVFYLINTNERVCNICNVHMLNTIDNMRGHLQSQRHIDSLKSENTAQTKTKLSDLSAASPTNTDTMIYCNICHVKMFDAHAVTSHLSSKRHRTTFDNLTGKDKQDYLFRWAQQFASQSGDKQNNSASVSTSHDTTRSNSRQSSSSLKSNNASDIFTCQICNVSLTKNLINILGHMKGKKHVQKLIELNTDFTCQICNVSVTKNLINILGHMKGKKHVQKLIELNTDSNKVPKNETTSNFNIQPTNFKKAAERYSPKEIKTSVYSNPQAISDVNINNPTTTNKNNNKVVCDINAAPPHTTSAVTNKTEISDSDDDDDGFYICKICNVLVKNNQTDIQSHLRSCRHHNNVEENKENAKEKSERVKLYFCEVCNCGIVDSPITIKTHNESISHFQRFYNILTMNKIRLRDNKVCYCELCDLYFNKMSALLHIAQEKHKKLIAEAAEDPQHPMDIDTDIIF